MLRHAVLQMLGQSVPVDLAVYAAADAMQTISDLAGRFHEQGQWFYRQVGENLDVHANTITLLNAVERESLRVGREFDVYAKIDDDDIYLARYIEDAVAHMRTGVDVSSCPAARVINDGIQPGMKNLGPFCAEDEARFAMPPTLVYNRRALEVLRNGDTRLDSASMNRISDLVWRHWWLDAGINAGIRESDQFWYHIHGRNISTASWYQGR